MSFAVVLGGRSRMRKERNIQRTYIDVQLLVQTIIEKQVVSHSKTVGLHWVPTAVVVVTNVPFECENQIVCLQYHRSSSTLYECSL